MINIYRKTNQSQKIELNAPGVGSWVNVVSPTIKEINILKKKFSIPEDFVYSSLDEDERPHIDKIDDFTFVIIRTPIQCVDNVYKIVPLGIILSKTNLIIISSEKTVVLDDFINNSVKTFSTTKKFRFLLQIFKNNNKYFNRYVDCIEKYIDSTERVILQTHQNKEIAKFLQLQKTIMYFHTAVVTNNSVFNKLFSSNLVNIYQEDKELLEDIITDNEQVIETLSIFSNILSNTMDAYASIVSNNLNAVMKFLASFTIILSIPTIVAGFYGMNVALPFQNNPYIFISTVILSVCIMIGLIFYFIKNNYF